MTPKDRERCECQKREYATVVYRLRRGGFTVETTLEADDRRD